MSDQIRKQLESGRSTSVLQQEALGLLLQLKGSWHDLKEDMSIPSSVKGVLPPLMIVDANSGSKRLQENHG